MIRQVLQLLLLGLFWQDCMGCRPRPSTHVVNAILDEELVLDLPSVPQLCRGEGILPFSNSPHTFGEEKLQNLTYSVGYLQDLLDSGCSDKLGRFLCIAHMPRPHLYRAGTRWGDVFLRPCREVCRDIWRECRVRARQLEIERTPEFSCNLYPSSNVKECLSHLYPPRDAPNIINATRHSPRRVSILLSVPDPNSVTQAFLVRFGEIWSPTKNVYMHDIGPSPFGTGVHEIIVNNLMNPGNYTFEIIAANDFGVGPKVHYYIPAFDLNSSRPVDVPNKDHCQNITVPMCRSGIDYTQTPLLGPLGHYTQDEAGMEINLLGPLIDVECSPFIRTFLCSIYIPRCETSGQLLPPCRDLCVQARNGCEELLNKYGFSWPDELMCEALPSYSDGYDCYLGGAPLLGPATSDRCEDITVSTCHHSIIGYNKTAMPNLMGHENQRDAGLQISTFEPLLQSDCSPHLRTFLCAMFIPRCDVSSSSVPSPCRELCVKARDGCQSLLREFGFDWPEGLRCENLPSQKDSSTCYSAETQTDGAEHQSNQTWLDTEVNTTRVVKPRRYDINTLGVPSLFRGWVDVQGQGAANDYCRVVTNSSGGYFLSCALAGMQGHNSELNYNSTGMWFDAGHMDTWYMLDVNKDGRDDYCRCVGCVPDTHVSCLLSGNDGFAGQTLEYDPVPGGCHYNPVNPFFGR